MNASAKVQAAVSERRSYEFSLPAKKFDQKEFLIALAFVGDVAMILRGLVFGFWIRFRSGWINWGNEPAGLQFVDYSGLMGLGGLFLVVTFAYLQLYSPSKIVHFNESALIIFKGTIFWLFAFLSLNLALRIQPP